MKPVLHYFKLSPNSIKVLITLHYKGVDFEPFAETRDRSKELLEANPRGKNPTLRTDDGAVFESTAINEYLEERYPEKPLMPKDLMKRARARAIVAYVDTGITADMSQIYYNKYRAPEAQLHEGALKALAEQLKGNLQAFEDKIIPTEGFLVGELSLADIALFVWVYSLKNATESYVSTDPYPKMNAWYDRMMQIEAVKHALPTA